MPFRDLRSTLSKARHEISKKSNKTMAAQAKKSTKSSSEPPLRILCFGDSLTSGYPVDQPYAERLAQKIRQAFPGREVVCEVEGYPGDTVTAGSFLDRMQMSWASAKRPYDWTIVLGGTNDIGWGRPADQIIEGLKRVWEIPLSKGSKVLALTIPETKARFHALTEKRNELNDAIRNYERENFFHFDLNKEFPYHDMAPQDRGKYWDMDGLHLQGAGYDFMGEKIGNGLVRILRLAEAQGTDIRSIVSDPRQRKAIEDLIYEEERGDPRLLSQGYIIVRKKDLD